MKTDSGLNLPEYHRTILNTMPLPVMVFDPAMQLQDYNAAAELLLSADRAAVLHRRGGDAMHCIHSTETPAGCGHGAACRTCVIRGSARRSLQGTNTIRQKTRMEFRSPEGVRVLDMLVTTAPIVIGQTPLVLLVLEDISELMTLRGLLPICARCKSIRDDRQFWQRIETYLHEHMQLDFSHGLCPECMAALYPGLYEELAAKKATAGTRDDSAAAPHSH
jgi:hypothetical protein